MKLLALYWTWRCDWDLGGGVGVCEVDKGAVKRCLLQLQKSCRTKTRRVSADVLKVFTLATELVKHPVASAPEATDGNAATTMLTIVDALKWTREDTKKANVELAKLMNVQKEMKETHAKGVDKLQKERVGEIIA